MNYRSISRFLPLTLLLATPLACNGEDPGNSGPNYPSYCQVEQWECVDFEDGPQLQERRHGHETVVIDHERVMLIGGWYRPDSSSQDLILDTCEIVNPITNEVRQIGGENATRCFRNIRRDPHVVRLNDGSVLAMGGVDADANRLKTTEIFDPETETWSWAGDLNIDYRARQFSTTVLDDGRVFLLRDEDVFGSHNDAGPAGEIFDPETQEWTLVEMPDIPIDTLAGANVPGTTKMILVLAEPDFLTRNPPIPEDPEEPILHQGHILHLGIYDIEDESWEELRILNQRGVGLTPQVVWIPEAEFMLVNIHGDTHRPTYGVRVDPESGFSEIFYERSPVPGQIVDVLPGDRILFHSNFFTQYYDIKTDVWWEFDAYPQGLTYSSVVQLEDCRLFASGERQLRVPPPEEGEELPPPAELRGVDTAYCTPIDGADEDDEDDDGDNHQNQSQ